MDLYYVKFSDCEYAKKMNENQFLRYFGGE